MSKNTKKTRTRTKAAATIPPFLHKIFEILESPEYNDMVSWNDEGNAFLIKNVTDFTEQVLPKYFKHNNFASFVRQLNLYDFHKSQYNNNGSEFYHKLFKRGEKDLLLEIKRKIPNETTTTNAADSPPQFISPMEDENTRPTNGSVQNSSALQDLIERQDRLEEATKVIYNQNKTLTKENKMLWSEVLNLKNKQTNTEKATRTINNQNTMLLKENRYLWNEFVAHREKYERQVEKLMLFLISIIRNSGANLYKKGGSTKLNANNQEEEPFESNWAPTNENENFSILPVAKISKQFGPKKNKSQIERLLERLEDDGVTNLLGSKPFVLDDKDLLVKFKTMLDIDTSNMNFPTLEFAREKRSNVFDHSFDNEEGRDKLSKLCKIENDALDTAVAVIREEKILPELPKLQHFNSNFGHERLIELASPMNMRMEEDPLSFNFGSADKKADISIDENLFLLDSDNGLQNSGKLGIPMSFPDIKHDDDNEDPNSYKTHKLLEKSFSELDIHNRNDLKQDDHLPWLDPLNNNLNISSDGKDPNYFFNTSGNLAKFDQSF